MDQMDMDTHPYDGTKLRCALQTTAQPPRKRFRALRLKAKNFFKKAINAGEWRNFSAGLGTGAAYSTLHTLHWHPHWVTTIELILFFTNVTIFSLNLIFLTINTLSHPRKGPLLRRLAEPMTVLMVPLIVLDYGTICMGAMLYSQEFGGPRVMNSFQGLFWSYLALSVVICGPMTVLWFGSGKSSKLRSYAMTGAFLFFPLMLVGTVAFNTLAVIEPTSSSALSIWTLGYVFQGLGMSIAFIFTTVHVYRGIRHGFHRGAAAGSTFVSIGPPGFTALAFLQLGSWGRKLLPIHTPLTQSAADNIYYASIPIALCLLGMALYLWTYAMIPWMCTFTKQIMYNPAGSWPLTFPCTGFTLTLALLGDALQSPAFWILHAFFTAYICLAFLIILPCWFYRILVPVDPELLEARNQYFDETYDHLDFWVSNRKAEEAEQKYLETSKSKHHKEKSRAVSVSVEPVNSRVFKTLSKPPIIIIEPGADHGDHYINLDIPHTPLDEWFDMSRLDKIDLSC